MVQYTERVCPACHGDRYHELCGYTGYQEPWICERCRFIFDEPEIVERDSDIIPKRRWEILLWSKWEHWQFHIAMACGKGIPFMYETWIGPICYRLWKDSRSVSSLSKAIRIVR